MVDYSVVLSSTLCHSGKHFLLRDSAYWWRLLVADQVVALFDQQVAALFRGVPNISLRRGAYSLEVPRANAGCITRRTARRWVSLHFHRPTPQAG